MLPPSLNVNNDKPSDFYHSSNKNHTYKNFQNEALFPETKIQLLVGIANSFVLPQSL
jgi:hypothetical protein